LPITVAEIGGGWSSALDQTLLQTVLLHTRFGSLYIIRIIGLIALLISCSWASGQRLLVSALAALLLILLSLTSHAVAGAADTGSLIAQAANDSAHLATGFWFGASSSWQDVLIPIAPTCATCLVR
jgi:putative copper export protein